METSNNCYFDQETLTFMNLSNSNLNSNLEKIYAFDYLRAISCIFVIALHSNIICFVKENQIIHDLIIFNLFDLAVPLFFQISLILFFLKREKQPDYFFKKRFFKLLKMYIFWGLFYQLFSWGLHFKNIDFTNTQNLIHIEANIKNIIIFIITDGKSPTFYFLFSLFFITSLAELFVYCLEKIKTRYQINPELISYIFLIISCSTVFLLPLIYMKLGENFSILTAVYNPLNFLPYIFSSFLISKSLSSEKINSEYNFSDQNIYYLIILFLSFFLIEWQHFSQSITWAWEVSSKEVIPTYSRVSLVICSWLITMFSFKIKSPPPWPIKIISDFSLGIYCLHIFFVLLIIKIFPAEPYPDHIYYFIFVVLLLVTIAITKIMRSFRIFQDII